MAAPAAGRVAFRIGEGNAKSDHPVGSHEAEMRRDVAVVDAREVGVERTQLREETLGSGGGTPNDGATWSPWLTHVMSGIHVE